MKKNVKYIFLIVGGTLVLINEISEESDVVFSVFGFIILIFGLYLTSKSIEESPKGEPSDLNNDQ